MSDMLTCWESSDIISIISPAAICSCCWCCCCWYTGHATKTRSPLANIIIIVESNNNCRCFVAVLGLFCTGWSFFFFFFSARAGCCGCVLVYRINTSGGWVKTRTTHKCRQVSLPRAKWMTPRNASIPHQYNISQQHLLSATFWRCRFFFVCALCVSQDATPNFSVYRDLLPPTSPASVYTYYRIYT